MRLLLFVAPFALLPLVTSSDYIKQVGIDTLVFMVLALGLNIAVGWAGILDLGYVAFYGFGAYAFAWVASSQFHQAWQAWYAVPLIVLATAGLGFLVGLPSRRLSGDYLAIVTLFFFQIFLTVVLNADRLNFPSIGTVDLTGGPNGIATVKAMNFFGYKLTTLNEYFYLLLITFTGVFAILYLINHSRTGRAWRAQREDSLAAEMMSIPVNWVKLSAFATGAAVAGLAGTIFAAEQGAVFPVDFDLTLLITIYAMVILGGSGSLIGVAIGALLINVSLEILRTPSNASWLFFGLLLIVLFAVVRPWKLAAAALAAIVGLGFAFHAIVSAVWPAGVGGASPGEATIDRWVEHFVILPKDPVVIGRWAYCLLIAAVLGLTLLKGTKRAIAFVPVFYLAAFVWENVLLAQPAVTRYILLGATLIFVMAARPQGLLGKPRVEIT